MYLTKVIKTKRKEKSSAIDIESFSKEIEKTLNKLKSENVQLIKILPVISGEYSVSYGRLDYGGGGYGFGYTDGVIIIGEKNE